MTRRQAIILVVALILSGIGFWVYSHSFISIRVPESSGKLQYKLINQNTQKVTTITSSDSTLKRLVTKGNYQVTVVGDHTSAVHFVKAKPFVQTTTVNTQLTPERLRTYIGSTPSFCSYYTDILYSYDCNSTYGTLKKHIPADESTPTYTENAPDINETLLGIFNLEGSPVVFTEFVNSSDESGLNKKISPLSSDMTLANSQDIRGLDAYKNYNALPYKEGILAYTSDAKNASYISTAASPVTKITIQKPTKATRPIAASTHKNQMVFSYNTDEDGGDNGLGQGEEQPKTEKGSTEVILYTNEKHTGTYTFDKVYTSVKVCGKSIICAVASEKLDVYKLDAKPEILFSMGDVQTVLALDDQFIVAGNKDVYSFNTNTLSGYIQYSFGQTYTYCGIQPAGENYTLCILEKDTITNALLIQPGVAYTDLIDQQLAILGKLPQVTDISTYGSFISISQYTGESSYSQEQQGYIYDQSVINQSTTRINEVIDEIGIDRGKYTISYNY